MAYQQQGGMGGGGQGGEHHGPQGTEYTLQGVMRFLQIEWHNHERARNAWDIERAEMKAKIAKQEGECRHSKRINEQLDRQVRMLEMALKNERAKKSGKVAPETKPTETEGQNAGKSKNRARPSADLRSGTRETKRAQPVEAQPSAWDQADFYSTAPNVPHNSFLDTEEAPETSEKELDQQLDHSTKFLKQCMREIQYLLAPPVNPPPPQMMRNGSYTGNAEPPTMSVEDIYVRQQRLGHHRPGQALPQPSQMPNYQPPPIPDSLPQASGPSQDAPYMARDQQYGHPAQASQQLSEPLPQPRAQLPTNYDDRIERVTHSFDGYGRPVPSESEPQPMVRQVKQQDQDGWTFDDDLPTQPDDAPPDVPPPRRPDTDMFPSAANNTHLAAKSPPRGAGSHRRKSSGSQAMSRRRSSQGKAEGHDSSDAGAASDPSQFKVKFALRGHLDVVRSVIFTGGGSPSEPEVCTAGDDGTIKRWIIPASYQSSNSQAGGSPDLDISSYFTHRGHDGIVTSLAACPASTGFSTGGRASGDGWIFSGGQDATIRVWERGRVDPKATMEAHTDTVWSVCVLPASSGAIFGPQSSSFGGPDRILLVSGSADGSVKVWAVSAPPQLSSPSTGSRRGVGGSRRHSVTSGSNFPSSPQPSVASAHQFNYTLVHSIERPSSDADKASPTCICPLSTNGETFVVSYTDSSVLIFDTRTGEEVIGMASNETYNGTMDTSINAVVGTSLGLEGAGTSMLDATRGLEAEEVGAGATGSREGVEGVVISGHEDRFVRFFDANSGQCTYTMLAHPSAISSLSLSKDGREAVSAGHDASIRFWSLEKRICTQDITSHRAMRGEGVCCVSWSQDGRLVVSAGGDGVVKVFAR